MSEGLMLVNVLPAFGLNEVSITTPLLRMKKISKITKKNLQLTKKYLPLQSQNKKGTQFFEVYFWMDTRRLDDEGGSYLLVMTD